MLGRDQRPFRVVMLCGEGFSSRAIFHALSKRFEVASVILEDKPSTRRILVRRAARIGWLKVVNQILFMVLNLLLQRRARPRIVEVTEHHGLNGADFPKGKVLNVTSANDLTTIKLLNELDPSVVLVNGTRILSAAVLASVEAPFINTHMGITPKYRGVHGGYWALASNDAENCGVTVHLVDQGIDTGSVLYQGMIKTSERDSFNTYPIHQLAVALPLIESALNDVKAGTLKPVCGVLPSKIWSHPTFSQYVLNWILYKVK